MDPIVTVIIPTHNSADLIDRCLESVLNQSEKNYEIITVDDQSTDDTRRVLQNYKTSLNNFSYFETPNRLMAGGARNIGLDHHKGKYVCFIDSDDWIDTNYLHYMISSIEEENSDVSISGVKREYPNAKDSEEHYKYNRKNVINGRYALCLLSRVIDQDIAISAITTNKIYRSQFIKKHRLRFLENSINEDDVFMFKVFLDATRVSITHMTYYHHFQRPNSISRSFSRKNFSDLMNAFNEIRTVLEDRNIFSEFRHHYYSFFEKCLQYVLESMRMAEQDEQTINAYLKYAYEISHETVSIQEFIEYCGYRRIERFFQ